jgi:hypothetical protein
VFHGNVRNISGNCLSVLLTSVKPVLRGHHWVKEKGDLLIQLTAE